MKKFLKYGSGLSIAFALITFMGANCGDPSSDTKKVENCSEMTDKGQEDCNNAEQKDGQTCEWRDDKCQVALANQAQCAALSDDDCKANIGCTHKDSTDPKCNLADSNIRGKCDAIQEQTPCDDSTKGKNSDGDQCEWDTANKKCIKQSGQANKDIYTWEKLALPGGDDEIQDFVMSPSGDMYLQSTDSDSAKKGLFHKSGAGAWARLGAGNNGILSGKPMTSAATDAALRTTSSTNKVRLKITPKGVIVMKKRQLAFVEAAVTKFAIDTAVHKSSVNSLDKIDDLADGVYIALAHMVDANLLVFGLATNKNVFLKNLNAAEIAPTKIALKNNSNTEIEAYWQSVGTSANGDILFGGGDEGVWVFPKANIALAAAPNKGKAKAGAAAIKPEDGKAWDIGTGTAANRNLGVTVVGSFNNSVIFAGMSDFFGNMSANTSDYGLAYEEAGKEAKLSYAKKKIYGTLTFDGKHYLKSDAANGLLGINADGTANTDHEVFTKDIKTNKDHMKADKSAVDIVTADTVRAVYGDADTAYIWVHGKGIFKRVKSQGKPRP